MQYVTLSEATYQELWKFMKQLECIGLQIWWQLSTLQISPHSPSAVALHYKQSLFRRCVLRWGGVRSFSPQLSHGHLLFWTGTFHLNSPNWALNFTEQWIHQRNYVKTVKSQLKVTESRDLWKVNQISHALLTSGVSGYTLALVSSSFLTMHHVNWLTCYTSRQYRFYNSLRFVLLSFPILSLSITLC